MLIDISLPVYIRLSRCCCCWDFGFASRSHNKNLVHPSFMPNGKGIGERVRGSSCVDSRTSQLVAPRCIYITFLSEFISFNCCCSPSAPPPSPSRGITVRLWALLALKTMRLRLALPCHALMPCPALAR